MTFFGVMIIVIGNAGKAVCISYIANIFGKGMNPTILPPAMGE